MVYSEALEKLIHEENLKSKISCQIPFKVFCLAGIHNTSLSVKMYT